MPTTSSPPTIASAQQLLGAERYRKACAAFELLAQNQSQRSAANLGWGAALEGLGNYEEAVDRYVAAYESDPLAADSLDAIARLRDRLKDPDVHLDRMESLVDGAADPAVHKVWAKFLHDSAQHDKAVKEFTKAEAMSPSGPAFYHAWAGSLAALGRHREALHVYGKAILADPPANDINAPYVELAASILALPDPDRGIQQIQDVADKTDRLDVKLRWAQTLYSMRRPDLGAREFGKTSKEYPDEPAVYSSWATALSKAGDFAAAAEKIAHAIELNPDALASYDSLDLLLGDPNNAGPLADRVTKSVASTGSAIAHERVGLALFHAGQNRLAVEQFQRAADLGSISYLTSYYWAAALAQLGNYAGALDKALEESDPALSWYFLEQFLQQIRDSNGAGRPPGPQQGAREPLGGPAAGAVKCVQARVALSNSEDEHAGWAAELLRLDLPNAAISHLSVALQKFPNSGRLHAALGDAYAAAKNPEQAIANYSMAIELQGSAQDVEVGLDAALAGLNAAQRPSALARIQLAVDKTADAKTHLWWGRALDKLAEGDRALAEFEAAVGLDGDNPEHLTALAEALGKQQRFGRAVDLCARAVRAASGALRQTQDTLKAFSGILAKLPKDDEAIRTLQATVDEVDGSMIYREWALTLGGNRRFKAELEQYRKALAKNPAWGTTIAELAYRLARAGKSDEALTEHQAAAEREPDSAFVHSVWGLTLSRLRRYEDAIGRYARASELERYPSADLLFDWALAYEGMQAYEEAAEKYDQGMKQGNVLLTAFASHNLASIEERRGDYGAAARRWDEALKHYGQAIDAARTGRHADFFVYYGTVFFELSRDLNQAEAQLAVALEIDSHHPLALVTLYRLLVARVEDSSIDPAQCEVATRCHARAREILARAMKLLERQLEELPAASSYVELGQLLLESSEYEQAKKAFLKAVELDKNDDAAYFLLSRACLGTGDAKEAIRYAREAVRRDRNNLSYRTKLAEALLKAESLDEAAAEYQAVLDIAPGHLDSLMGAANTSIALGEASQKAGKTADAESHFEQALDHLTSASHNGATNSSRLSRPITPVEKAAVAYAAGYARVRLYESQSVAKRDDGLLKVAAELFDSIPRNDANYYKAQRARARIRERVRGPVAKAVKLGERSIAVGAGLVFLAANLAFWWGKPHFTETTRFTAASVQAMRQADIPAQVLERIEPVVTGEAVPPKVQATALRLVLGDSLMARYGDSVLKKALPGPLLTTREPLEAGMFALLAFGSLMFMVVGFYLEQLSKLSFGGIALEKTSEIAPRETGGLGISAPSSSAIKA